MSFLYYDDSSLPRRRFLATATIGSLGSDLPLEDKPDEEVAALCQQASSGVTGKIMGAVSDAIENSPCVEMAIRRKVAKKLKANTGKAALGIAAILAAGLILNLSVNRWLK